MLHLWKVLQCSNACLKPGNDIDDPLCHLQIGLMQGLKGGDDVDNVLARGLVTENVLEGLTSLSI